MAAGWLAGAYEVVVDAIFGFGFKSDPRPPFDTILDDLSKCAALIVSVDVPSGWSVRSSRAHGNTEKKQNKTKNKRFRNTA